MTPYPSAPKREGTLPCPEERPAAPTSPPWSPTTKLIVGLTLVAVIIGLVVYFRAYIGPLTLAFILSYLLHPVVAWLERHTPLSWRAAVGLVYLSLVVLLVGLLTLSGLAVVQQAQNLYAVVSDFLLTTLPRWLDRLAQHPVTLGPLRLDLSRFDLNALSQSLLASVQPLLGQLGGLLSGLATGMLQTLARLAFVLLVSYFLLAESGRVSADMFPLQIPGYQADVERLERELGYIWNAFLRGQFMVALAVGLINWVGLTVLGVRNALVLALLVMVGRFVPYLGPLVVYVVTAMMVLLQPAHPWGWEAWRHALLVIGFMMVVDQIFDSVVVPKVMGEALGVHPAAVLVGALVLARLIGVVGLLLAAPIVASLRLIGHYVLAKLRDRPDPWEGLHHPKPPPAWAPWGSVRRWLGRRGGKGQPS